jgi:hypothetical protein
VIQIFDDFLVDPDTVRQSALASGFGSWKPSKGAIGSSVYEGMNFYGDHSTILETIYKKAGFVGFPSSMLFRVTNADTERAYVHSDVASGDMTCITYLSDHSDKYGTGFYRHRESGLFFMPPLDELAKYPEMFEKLKADINDSGDAIWEEVEFVQGQYNRAVVFQSHRWHRRFPEHGFGTDEHSGRMIHICHFRNGKLP